MADPSASVAGKVPIQAVVRAFSVLEILATKPTGVRLAELSRIAGLHKTTVHRLVRTMVLLGYVAQTAEGEPYRIDRQLLGGSLRAAPGPGELDPPRRAAEGLASFAPAKRDGAGKSRAPRAAIVRPARQAKADAHDHGG